MTHQPETARELLHRHGLPEDIIDGALCLHAQELAAQQRKAHDELRPYSHMGLPCKPEYECGARRVIDLIDPTRTPAAVSAAVAPPTNRAAVSRKAEAELYVLLRKAGEPRDEAQALIDRHRDEVLRRAELRRMADETATETPDAGPCAQHPTAPVIGGICGGCTQYPADFPARRPPMDPVHILGIWVDDEPAAGARQDGDQP